MTGRKPLPPPRGAALVAVLVCILVVTLLSGSLLHLMLLQHRQSGTHLRAVQAMWLSEAGMRVAKSELANNPENNNPENNNPENNNPENNNPKYTGADLEVALDHQGEIETARIEIRIERDVDAGRIRIRVSTLWPDDPIHRQLDVQTAAIPLTSGESP